MSNEIKNNLNALVSEKSPYLRMHAKNPVDWLPWGGEAFRKAKEEDKPVFVSIGYSACHWCHVMAEDAFSDPLIAEMLNRDYISIKVDREERPDIDLVAMRICRYMNGGGGWPLNLFLFPDRRPFFSGTWFPAYDRDGMPGMKTILTMISTEWAMNRIALGRIADQTTLEVMKENMEATVCKPVDLQNIDVLASKLEQFYDKENGGFGTGAKFPMPTVLLFLISHCRIYNDTSITDILTTTMKAMTEGGMWDHIGDGFFRYTVDPEWKTPHYEKMLSDNALLAIVLFEMYELTGVAKWKDIGSKVLGYLERDMRSEDGGFFTSEDADANGEEGAFYLFDRKELNDVLGDELSKLAGDYFDIPATGKSLPAPKAGVDDQDALDRIELLRNRLVDYRRDRHKLFRDEKVITGWNGLVIAAYSVGGRILKNEKYVHNAARAAEFLLSGLRREDGRLAAYWKDGEAVGDAFLDDYAFLVWGLLELFRSSGEQMWLAAAVAHHGLMDSLFKASGSACYFTPVGSEDFMFRPLEFFDTSIPAGNAVIAGNLCLLGKLTGKLDFAQQGKAFLEGLFAKCGENPFACAQAGSVFINMGNLPD